MPNTSLSTSGKKPRLLPSLYLEIFFKLSKSANSVTKKISLPEARSILATFGVSKEKSIKVFAELESFSLIRVHPYNDIEVLRK